MKEQNLFSATAALQAVLALQPGALYTVSTVLAYSFAHLESS